ncbi:aldehyde dehydrogenase family protein [Mycobacterium simiae]|uniref:aldehyde dehydrogenase family protein n=1 Tax=Mycobacterium simiae TaxID=1784 RepID=UPI002604B90E|nr:aldehyde dehydrogenase family protein [Mycobacterium simiae]
MMSELRRVFAAGRTRGLQWRLQQLRGVESLLHQNEADIARALADDLGRSSAEAWIGDVAPTAGEAAYARRNLKRWMRRKRRSMPLAQRPGKAWVQYEPVGVVLIIGPWNYPLSLCLTPLVAAVAAGNCAVIKPSELAPATSALLARLVPQYLDRQAVRVVQGDADLTQDLLAQGFDHAFFTGGTEVGKKIMAAAAATLTPVTLELGGKSPVIVTADADLDVAARRIASVKLLNSGQTCIAPDYVLAEQPVAEQLAAKIVADMRQFRSGHTDFSLPIVNQRQFDRLTSLLAATEGKLLCGGGSTPSDLSIEPTVLLDPSPIDPVMVEEIFGPILPVLSVESIHAAIDFVNTRPHPLALYVFASSERRAQSIIDRTPSGGAVINHVGMQFMVPQLPFGGIGASGMGAYHGRWGFEALSHRRAVLSKPTAFDPKLLYPPYSDRALKIVRSMLGAGSHRKMRNR